MAKRILKDGALSQLATRKFKDNVDKFADMRFLIDKCEINDIVEE